MKIYKLLGLFLILIVSNSWADDTAKTKDNMSSAVADSSLLKNLATYVDSTSSDSLMYEADSAYVDAGNERCRLMGNSVINYQTTEIRSDSIFVDFKQNKAISKGRIYMKDDDQLLIGDEVHYDIESQMGFVTNGASKFEKGFYYGEEMRKVAKRVYDVDNGEYTSCDAEEPHFYIRSKQFRVYQGDLVVGKPIIFYVNHFPIFGMPFGTFSIKRGRHTGILVPEPGYNSTDGKYLKNIAFYYAYKDYADGTVSFDFMEKTGWQAQFESNYAKRYEYNGNLQTVLRKRIYDSYVEHYDWSTIYTHSQQLADKASFDMNLNFASSKDVWQGNTDIDKRLQQSLTSSFSYRRPLYSSMLYASGSYTDNFTDKTKSILLPSLSYSLPSKPVYELFPTGKDSFSNRDFWWKNFSYSYNTRLVQTGSITDPKASFSDVIWNNEKDSTGKYISEHHLGMQHNTGLTYSYAVLGWLRTAQTISYREAWFDRDKNDNKIVRGNDYSFTSSVNFSLYGIRNFKNNYIRSVRHIATPSLSFSYVPDFTENKKFYSFGGVGVGSGKKSRSMSFGLDNKWQMKIPPKGEEKVPRTITDFVTLNSSMSYAFDATGRKWSDIHHTAGLHPLGMSWKPFSFTHSYSASANQSSTDWQIYSYNLSANFNMGGDAKFVDYFPETPNRFVTNEFFQDDSTSVKNNISQTIEEIEKQKLTNSTWQTAFDFDYNHSRGYGNSSNLRTNLSTQLTQKWSLTYSNYINLKTKEIISHSIFVTRDLHCWKLTFSWTKSGDYWDYRMVLFNIQLPESLRLQSASHKD